MAEEPESISAFPPPPMMYIKNYTDSLFKNGLSPKPPAVPEAEPYVMFGNVLKADDPIIVPLENQDNDKLFPDNSEPKAELRKLNHSILINFLDLIDGLIKNPDSEYAFNKLKDLQTLFINAHHLINEYRPHQARETLRVMLQNQLKQKIEMNNALRDILNNSIETLSTSVDSLSTISNKHEGELREILKVVVERTSESQNSLLQSLQDTKTFVNFNGITDLALK